jgi:peroxiredoxin
MTTDTNPVGGYAPDFELPSIDKKVYHLGRYLAEFKTIAVVFIDNDSPEVARYLDRLKAIQAEFEPQGFTLIGINSNDDRDSLANSVEKMQNFAREQDLNFPYLRDPTQDVAKSFKVKVMPTVFLLDNQTIIRYAGKIDDRDRDNNYTQDYLSNSIKSILAGKAIEPNYIPPVGSPIQWRQNK